MDRLLSLVPLRGQRPILFKIRSSKLFIIVAVCTAVFTDVFLYGVVIPVLPFAIHVRANVAENDVQHWVSVLFSLYGAALLVAAPICGFIADRTKSRQAPLLGGLIVLAGATVMLCLGRSIGTLVAGRILQGASAAFVWTVALALLSDTVGKEQSGQALGYCALSYSLGVLVAPLLGGVVYAQAGYYAVFAMTFAVIALDIVLRLLIIEKKAAKKWLPDEQSPIPPVPDAVELQETTGPLKTSTETGKGMVAAQTDSAAKSSPKRKLPTILILMKSRRLQAAFLGTFVPSLSIAAFDSTLPLFVNRTFGWTSLGAGLIFTAILIPSFAGPLLGHWTDKYGPRWLAAGGLFFSMPFWVLLRFVDHNSIQQKVLLCALLVFLGAAFACTLTSLMAEFSKICDEKERHNPGLFGNRSAYAQSYGIFNVAWAAGALVGPLWAASVQKEAGWKTFTWTIGLLNTVSAVPVFLYSGGFVFRAKDPDSHVDSSV